MLTNRARMRRNFCVQQGICSPSVRGKISKILATNALQFEGKPMTAGLEYSKQLQDVKSSVRFKPFGISLGNPTFP